MLAHRGSGGGNFQVEIDSQDRLTWKGRGQSKLISVITLTSSRLLLSCCSTFSFVLLPCSSVDVLLYSTSAPAPSHADMIHPFVCIADAWRPRQQRQLLSRDASGWFAAASSKLYINSKITQQPLGHLNKSTHLHMRRTFLWQSYWMSPCSVSVTHHSFIISLAFIQYVSVKLL